MMRNAGMSEKLAENKFKDEVWGDDLPMGPPTDTIVESAPNINLQGVIRSDGYEYVEWPPDEGSWWFRSHAGLPWSKWEN
jgi:hypothetical protein